MISNGHLEKNSFQCSMALIFARQVTKGMIEKTKTYVHTSIICRAVGTFEKPSVCVGGGGDIE